MPFATSLFNRDIYWLESSARAGHSQKLSRFFSSTGIVSIFFCYIYCFSLAYYIFKHFEQCSSFVYTLYFLSLLLRIKIIIYFKLRFFLSAENIMRIKSTFLTSNSIIFYEVCIFLRDIAIQKRKNRNKNVPPILLSILREQSLDYTAD